MALSECPECSRHVRLGTRVCPFCDHALPAGFGRSRAVLVGAAALTAMTACSRIMATKYGGPPPPPPDDAGAVDATEPPDELEAPEADASEEGEAGEAPVAEPEAQ